jgi:recombination protein RecA
MDTDGYNDSGKVAEYTTVSEKLAYDFVEIIQSLGYTGKIKYRTTKCDGKVFPSYRVHISGNDISKLFSITRKKIDHKRIKGDLFRTIRKVEVVRSEECRCIELDNNDHLYLTNNFVVTHNSTTCLQICKNAQDEGRPVIYIDGESRLKAYNLSGTHGLDLDKIQIVHSPEDSESLSAEDFLDIAESLFKRPENNGAVCIIDSCSSLVPRSELEESSSATIRASLPKLLAHWIKKNAQNVVKNKIIVVIITHYITNTSGYGKVKVPDCGTMVQYQADTRMDITKIEPWEENSKKVGQLVHWRVGCSSLGSSGTDCISYIKYNKGIDKEKEIIELAESFGIIEKGGAWYSIPFLDKTHGFDESPKFQGQSKIYDFLVERKDIFDLIKKQVKEML